MKNLIIKTNKSNNKLYCVHSKERIHIGERYVTVYEEYLGQSIEKTYKKECINFLIADDYE